jgi:hypothetical protein
VHKALLFYKSMTYQLKTAFFDRAGMMSKREFDVSRQPV